jgi:RHS repeat-associated protein
VYDAWDLVAILNPQSSILQSFMWGLDLSGTMQGAGGVGGLLLTLNAELGTRNFVGYDGNGNVTVLMHATNGAASANYEYGPFGELVRATGLMAKANPFRFSTKFQDDESDLLYYGYRFYNQATGRWLSRDPIVEKGGINLMAFVQNNPVNRHEYLGLAATGCEEICKMALKNDSIAWFLSGGGIVCYSGKASRCKTASVNCSSSIRLHPSGVRRSEGERSEPSAAEPRKGVVMPQ